MNSLERVSTPAIRIREAMDMAGKKQVDLVNETGLQKSAISRYISGEYEPKQTALYKIGKVLDVSEMWLAGYDIPMERIEMPKYNKELLHTTGRCEKELEIGKKIKNARIANGLTQEELGKLVGVQKSAVAKWENGRVTEIKRSSLKLLSESLGLKPEDLLCDIFENTGSHEQSTAFSDISFPIELQKMIEEYNTLNDIKKSQVREYVHLLSLNINL